MISALDSKGSTIVATTEIDLAPTCPSCLLTLKVRSARGKATHFIHPKGASCQATESKEVRSASVALQLSNQARTQASEAGQLELFDSPYGWTL